MMWSPVEKTALAEAEVEYHDLTSHTIWVRFRVTGLEPSRLDLMADNQTLDEAMEGFG